MVSEILGVFDGLYLEIICRRKFIKARLTRISFDPTNNAK